MAIKIRGEYLGSTKVKLTHPSGSSVTTVAPKDNGGDGSMFSPTDMCAASLGACMLTIMGMWGEKQSVDLSGMYMEVEKHMSSEPRRIGELPVTIHIPKSVPEEKRERLQRAALTCPVHHSLHPEIKVEVSFLYDI